MRKSNIILYLVLILNGFLLMAQNNMDNCFIDKEKGIITIDSTFKLTKDTKENELINADLIYRSDCINGYQKHYSDSILIGGIYFGAEFIFMNDKLLYVYLSMSNEPVQIKQVWPDYQEDHIEAKKRKYDSWLDTCLDRKRKFEWGKIDAFVEPKMWNTMIKIQYN